MDMTLGRSLDPWISLESLQMESEVLVRGVGKWTSQEQSLLMFLLSDQKDKILRAI